MKEVRRGTFKLYKGSYIIVFYDRYDRYLKYMFDNVRDILKFMKQEPTRTNVNRVNVEIYRALKTDTHFTRFLNGELLRVYIIDTSKENDDDGDESIC